MVLQDLQQRHVAFQAANFTSNQLLPWLGEKAPLFGSKGGKLGVEIEVTLPTKSIIGRVKQVGLGLFVDQVLSQIRMQLMNNGVAATVEANGCRCFIDAPDKLSSTLPILIIVTGIDEYSSFAKSQLGGVTDGLFKQLQEGGPPVPTDLYDAKQGLKAAVDAQGEPIKSLKAILQEHPAMKDSVQTVKLKRTINYKGLKFSNNQFLLEVELSKYDAIASQVGSKSVASIVGSLGKGTSLEIIEAVYGQLAGQIAEQISKAGINILVSGPTIASEAFNNIGPLSLGASRALHAGGAWRSVIPLNYPEMQQFKFNRTVGTVPDGVPGWKRKSEKGTLAGFRLVMTVTSINENFAQNQLPVIRDGVAKQLGDSLPQGLREFKMEPTVVVNKCGFKPKQKLQPPFPHDHAGCTAHTSLPNKK